MKKPKSIQHCFPALLCLFLAWPLFAQAPQRTEVIPGQMDPFSVTLFRNPDYSVPIGTWKLAPGMRLLKVPSVKAVPRSVLVGAKVSVLLFPSRDFSSTQPVWNAQQKVFVEYDSYLIPFFRFRTSSAKMFPEKKAGEPETVLTGQMGAELKEIPTKTVAPRVDCSIVIHRRDIDDMVGVSLESTNPATPCKRFYPLAERAADQAIVYEAIPARGPFILTVFAGGSGQMTLYPSTSPPNPNNLLVTIFTPYMTLELPEKNAETARFDLRALGIEGDISRMKIRYIGPLDPADYSEAKSMRAPGAQDIQAQMLKPLPAPVAAGSSGKEPVSLAGTWQSNVGAEYVFSQSGAAFTWTAASLGQQGSGTIAGMKVTTQMAGGGVFNGQVIEVDPAGAARRIDWENGVIIFRQGAAIPPAAPAVADLAGDWQGFMNMTFSFTQNGSQFAWFVQATGEKAQGTIAGDVLTVTWTNPLGSGSAKGKIAAKDASGRATRIEWDNGVVFSR
ncbi:MAG: hypothetical protein MUC57_15905 [Desulfobacterales bacterium]|jgi:hypothetical protein|nr:hypothetical protein [Desulfobacterales bacterium]